MSADVIQLNEHREPPNPGNGAREAMIRMGYPDWSVDFFLANLWLAGFKVVPLDGGEDRTA